MAVQDDSREKEVCQLLGLREGEGRSEVDAFFDFAANGTFYSAPIELKSTTTGSVSTARDVGPIHIAKWRSRIWIFGFYNSSGASLRQLLVLGPNEMESWIEQKEQYIKPDFAIGDRVAEKLDVEDLYIICEKKRKYSLEDAKSLHKRQWNQERYRSEMDDTDGYTPEKMLEILKLRAIYLNQRGSTLNNPHIPKSLFANFRDQMIDVTRFSADARATVHQTLRDITLSNKTLQWNR
ncbi:MAG: hypothetical protein F4X17_17350 [Gemmatimonadetes bacterium]|nr:hypothetical protein [Gemmatimonadota bacterium]